MRMDDIPAGSGAPPAELRDIPLASGEAFTHSCVIRPGFRDASTASRIIRTGGCVTLTAVYIIRPEVGAFCAPMGVMYTGTVVSHAAGRMVCPAG